MGLGLLGFSLLVFGLFLMLLAGVLFLTIILIPFAIIAGIVGLIMVITCLAVAFAMKTYQVYSQGVKYCTVCGAQNAMENKYCKNCGTKFPQNTF